MVSIILPVYNGAQFLNNTFESVLTQKDIDLEVVVVDDGSTDDSLELCRKIEGADRRVRVFSQKNMGVSSARNFGIQQARGEYIAFLDQDDTFLENALTKNLKLLMENKADFIKFARRDIVIANDKVIKQVEYNQFGMCLIDSHSTGEYYVQLRKNMMFSSVWNGIYRKDFLVNNRIYFNDKIKGGCEDQLFNLFLLQSEFVAIYVPELGYVHYIRKGTSTSTKFCDSLMDALPEVCEVEMQYVDILSLKQSERAAITCEYIWRMFTSLIRYPGKDIIHYGKMKFRQMFGSCSFDNKPLYSFALIEVIQVLIYRLFCHKRFVLLGFLAYLLRTERKMLKRNYSTD